MKSLPVAALLFAGLAHGQSDGGTPSPTAAAAASTSSGAADAGMTMEERALLWGTEKENLPESDVAAPPPIHKLNDLDVLAGKWKCTGRVFGGPGFGSQSWKDKATFTIKRGLDRWFLADFAELRSKDIPMPLFFRDHWGYDGVQGKFVRTAVANTGDIILGTSPGWEGDVWTWTGTWTGDLIIQGSLPIRHSLTLRGKGKKELYSLWEFLYKGNWLPGLEHTCKR